MVLQQLGIFGEDRGGGGVLDMRFQRDRAIGAQHLHQLRHEEDDVEEILLLVFRTLEDLAQAPAEPFEFLARIADDQRAGGGTADDEHFVRNGFEDGAERAAGEGEATEHHAEQDDDTDDRKHGCRSSPKNRTVRRVGRWLTGFGSQPVTKRRNRARYFR